MHGWASCMPALVATCNGHTCRPAGGCAHARGSTCRAVLMWAILPFCHMPWAMCRKVLHAPWGRSALLSRAPSCMHHMNGGQGEGVYTKRVCGAVNTACHVSVTVGWSPNQQSHGHILLYCMQGCWNVCARSLLTDVCLTCQSPPCGSRPRPCGAPARAARRHRRRRLRALFGQVAACRRPSRRWHTSRNPRMPHMAVTSMMLWVSTSLPQPTPIAAATVCAELRLRVRAGAGAGSASSACNVDWLAPCRLTSSAHMGRWAIISWYENSSRSVAWITPACMHIAGERGMSYDHLCGIQAASAWALRGCLAGT